MPESAISSAQTDVVTATFVREDDRGLFVEAVNDGPWETVITGRMCADAIIGNHYHKRTRMFFFLLDGNANVAIVNVKSQTRRQVAIGPCEGLFLEPGEAHAICFRADSTMLLLKSIRFDPDASDTFAYDVIPDMSDAGAERA